MTKILDGTAERAASPAPSEELQTMSEKRTRPKLAIGDTVTYRGNRRLRRKVTDRYWDANYPGWRYRLNEKGLRKDIAARWAVIEDELVLIKTAL